MKAEKSKNIDPIRDKYTKKVGFFKKIQINYNNFLSSVKNNKSFNSDKKFFIEASSKIIIYGASSSFAATLFGMNISVINFLALGCGLWLFEEKIIGFITSILGSIKFVEVRN